MEEEKAAAYYDELTRKGSGAARFKQGLGFSSDKDDAVPTKGSVLSSPSSSSFLSKFVKASSPTKSSQLEKQAQLSSIQNKLKKNPEERGQSRDSEGRSRERDHRERHSKRRSRSRSRSRERHRDRDRDRDRHRERRRSVERRRSEKNGEREKAGKEERIQGFDKMSPAERVKAKMKLQLAETAEKDASMGMGSGWERFEFDKDAPLDDEEIEAVEDDAALVKHIGQSFRFSAIEARREEKVKAAHDEAMFGASTFQPSVTTDSEPEVDNNKKESNESGLATSLLSEKVLAKQQGSWRDRARKG